LRVIKNVVSFDVWDIAESRVGERARNIDVLFVGNLIPVKGPDILIQVARALVERRPASSICLVGSGQMENEVRRLAAEAGIIENVSFAGRVKRREVCEYLSRSRILAIPSRSEGLPLCGLEAQLFGVPVVGHAVGGVSQAFLPGTSGSLIPFGDIEAFTNALITLLDDEAKWRRFSDAASTHARAIFNPQKLGARYASVYHESLLVSASRRSRS
jgi:glycosyltransferase involved in cell wall biosynthesis